MPRASREWAAGGAAVLEEGRSVLRPRMKDAQGPVSENECGYDGSEREGLGCRKGRGRESLGSGSGPKALP